MQEGKHKIFKLPLPSEYNSRAEWEDACWRKILSAGLENFLFTSHERHNIVMRVAVASNLNFKSKRQISRDLFVSRQTIDSIEKSLLGGDYKSYRERGKSERKKKSFSPTNTSTVKRRGKKIRTKYGDLYMP